MARSFFPFSTHLLVGNSEEDHLRCKFFYLPFLAPCMRATCIRAQDLGLGPGSRPGMGEMDKDYGGGRGIFLGFRPAMVWFGKDSDGFDGAVPRIPLGIRCIASLAS